MSISQAGASMRTALGSSAVLKWRPSTYVVAIVVGYAVAVVAFAVTASLKGVSGVGVVQTTLSTLTDGHAMQEALLRAVPIGLAALAVAIPARAGLVNVGGEGQLIIGAVAATGIGVAVGAHVPGPISWVAMGVSGAVAGAAWGGLSGLLRTVLGASEAVTSLLLNFVANDIMLYLIYQPWKDPNGSGQPQSRPLAAKAHLPHLFGQLNWGVLVAAAAVGLCWYLLRRTGWGFALRAVGGNGEAARRSGLPVNRLLLSSMIVGGAFAGLGGALNLAGLETQLRPDITASFGYVGFLAAFLGGRSPLRVAAAAVVFSIIALSGNNLQILSGLDGTIVNILLALVVAVPLVAAKYRRQA